MRRSIAASLLVVLAAAAAAWAAAPPPAAKPAEPAKQPPTAGQAKKDPAPREAGPTREPTPKTTAADPGARLRTLRAQLEREQKRLEQLETRLAKARKGQADEKGKALRAKNEGDATQPPPKTKPAGPPLHSLPAADVLYRLGRFDEALAAYSAAAKNDSLDENDRIWALLRAATCHHRLKHHDAAVEMLQTLQHDYPDHPWTERHVAWALKVAQWEKRWHRPTMATTP